jgi:hypothetical protein
MSAPRRRIEVAIDELVLHGFDPRHRQWIAEAVQAELAAALEGWSPAAGASVDQVEAGSFTVPAAAPPAVVGRGVARQIGQVLHSGTRHAETRQTGGQQAGTQRPAPPERRS